MILTSREAEELEKYLQQMTTKTLEKALGEPFPSSSSAMKPESGKSRTLKSKRKSNAHLPNTA